MELVFINTTSNPAIVSQSQHHVETQPAIDFASHFIPSSQQHIDSSSDYVFPLQSQQYPSAMHLNDEEHDQIDQSHHFNYGFSTRQF